MLLCPEKKRPTYGVLTKSGAFTGIAETTSLLD